MTRIGLKITTALGAALMLAACHQDGAANNAIAEQNTALPALPEAVPMQAGPATAASAAPSAAALPVARPVGVAALAQPSDAYAYADRATGFSDAIGDAPPDYAFDYDGVSPWAWQTGGGDTEFAEPVDGGYRYYYYQPGESQPYLVRDPSYSYAYDGPNLVAVYGVGGALLAGAAYRAHLDAASRYRARASALYQASREREHRGVVAANWAARRSEIAAARSSWSSARDREPQWQAYHQAHEATEQEHWTDERDRRIAASQRFQKWQRDGYRGAAPDARPDTGRTDQRSQPQRDTGQPDRREGQPDQPQRHSQPERDDHAREQPARSAPIEPSGDDHRPVRTAPNARDDHDRDMSAHADRPSRREEQAPPPPAVRHDMPDRAPPRLQPAHPAVPHEAPRPAAPRADTPRPAAPRAEVHGPAVTHGGERGDHHPG